MAFGLTNTVDVYYNDQPEYSHLSNARSVEFVEIGANGFVYVGGFAGLVSFSVDQTNGSLLHIETIDDDSTLHLGGSGGFATAVIGANTFLFHVSSASSGVSAFSIDALTGVLTPTGDFGDDGPGGTIAMYGANSVAAATIGGNTYLFVTSENDDGLAVLSVNGMGALNHVESVFDGGSLKLNYARDVATAVIGATTYVFTGANFDGISVFSADNTGHLTPVFDHAGGGTDNYANGEVETATVDGTTYLISSGYNADGLSVFSVDTDGHLANVFNVTDDGNVALDNVEWLETKVLGGVTYLFVAAPGENALSVWTVNADGSLTNVANVYDDADIYLEQLFSLGVGADDGTPYLIAQSFGGGISLFELTPPSPPSASDLTQTKTYAEDDASVALDDIVVTDPDSGEMITATLTLTNVAAGALTTAGGGGYNAGSGIWTITDTVANVNIALAAVSFTPAPHYDVDATITTHIEDAAHTGPADGLITLDVTPANDAPAANNLTNTKTYTEGAASVDLDNIVVSELDTSSAQTITATLTLNAPTSGVLTTAGGGTYTSGTGVWTITGTVTQVNTALASVSFTPATNNDADTTITTRIRDQSAVGPPDGAITLDVTPVNDLPAASNLTQTKAYTEGAASVALDDIVVSEVDTSPAQTITATLTLSNTAAGVLTTAGGGSYNTGTGIWSITGTVVNVNIALASVSFTPATDNDADTTIATHIEDQNVSGPANGSITLDVTPVNDAPAATNLTQTKAYAEGAASVALDDIVVSDVDTSPAQTITATLTLSNTAAGILTASGGATYAAGTGIWTVTGTAAQVNAALAAVAFTPATNNDADATITTHIQDQNAAGPANGAITLDVTPVNDPPTAQNGSASGNENTAINGTLVASDIDSLSLTYSRVTQAAHGTVTVNPNGTFSYTPNADYDGTDSFTFKANDGSEDSNIATVSLTVNGTGATPSDFNGDGSGDILWQTNSGALAIWEMSGAQISLADYTRLGQSAVGVPGPDWHIVDTGDFNGDSKSDILWRTDSGALALWKMDGTHIESADFLRLGSATVGTPGTDWHALGATDFDGDGKTDILWRTDSGALAIWKMDGNQVTGADFIHSGANKVGQPGTDWHIVGTGDFDGDGKGDLLWRTNSNALAVWEMDGTQIKSADYLRMGSSAVSAPGTDWHVADVADFNGDGRADILWRVGAAQTGDLAPGGGQVAIWEMNGNQIAFADYTRTGSTIAGAPGSDWHLLGADDNNGDGMADLLWQTDSGALAIWEMDGTQIDSAGYTRSGANVVGAPGSDWHIFQHHYDLV